MAALTSSGSGLVGRKLEEGVSRPPSHHLQDEYEVHRCLEWIRAGGYQKVCLQFPDELLGDATGVAHYLTHHLGRLVYILADTTYGSCCVDEVAAEHVGADAVIHYGRTCLSPSRRLPILYVLTRLPVDATRVVAGLVEAVDDTTQRLILVYDTRCHYAIGDVVALLSEAFPSLLTPTLLLDHAATGITERAAQGGGGGSGCCAREGGCCVALSGDKECGEESGGLCGVESGDGVKSGVESGDSVAQGGGDSCTQESGGQGVEDSESGDSEGHVPESGDSEGHVPESGDSEGQSGGTRLTFIGRAVCLPAGANIRDYKFIFLGPSGPTLTCLLVRFPECVFYHVEAESGQVRETSGTKAVMARSAKLELARDAQIIGILVGTLGVAGYRDVVARLRKIIRAAGKRSYTLAVGKPNEPKLANISEVDAFVYVACPETTVLERHTDPPLYRKLLAPWELEVALLPGQEWALTLESDFRALLPGGARHVEVDSVGRPEEASVSLLTNRTQRLGLRDATALDEQAGAMVVQNGRVVATLHTGGGGEVLARRGWAGLDPSLPAPHATGVVVEGLAGIAAGYDHEK